MATSEEKPKQEDEKTLGNQCLKNGNYAEAVLHYTYATKKDPKNPILYSNRSLAFLKLQDYFHALDDAKSAIRLDPSWPKGYFRKGEVEFETEHYEEAFHSYRNGVLVQKEDTGLLAVMNKAAKAREKQQKSERRWPWVGIGSGWLFGMVLVAAHELTAKDKTMDYLIVKILFSLVFAGLGYAAAMAWAYISKNQREALLQPPLDLLDAMGQKSSGRSEADGNSASGQDSGISGDSGDKHRRRPGGTSAGRQRFKMGKS